MGLSMQLEDFLNRQQAGGETVTTDSVFTLDPVKVRERVATFIAQERLYPLYRCLQAILRVTESDLFLHYQDETWIARFRWEAMPSPEHFIDFLESGVSVAFDHAPSAATQHFFFGCSAVLGEPRYGLALSSPQGGILIRNGAVTLDSSSNLNKDYCELRFAIESSWWKRLTGLDSSKEEGLKELRRRLCYSAIPIHLEGERLQPSPPIPPDQPWAARFSGGSNLAWRILSTGTGGRLRPPEVPLDHYRRGGDNEPLEVMHLIGDSPDHPLPLSVQFSKTPLPLGPDTANPHLDILSPGTAWANSFLCLSLNAGRQDWLFPVRDGFVCEPTPIKVAHGGILIVSAAGDLRYDLSGLNVVTDANLERWRKIWVQEAKLLRSQLRLSLANIGLRSESMPSQYYQASGYVLGGPYAGILGGKLTPWLKSLSSKDTHR